MSAKYYWIQEFNPADWEITNLLIDLGATHIATNMFGDKVVRRFVKKLKNEELLIIILKHGDKFSIWPVTDAEEMRLTEKGYIKS